MRNFTIAIIFWGSFSSCEKENVFEKEFTAPREPIVLGEQSILFAQRARFESRQTVIVLIPKRELQLQSICILTQYSN